MKALARTKNHVIKWNGNAVAYSRKCKTECYHIDRRGSVNPKLWKFTTMEITERIFDGPDCYSWMKSFAYWPVKTIGGKYVWLKPIYKQRFWGVWGAGFHMEPEVEYAELLDILAE